MKILINYYMEEEFYAIYSIQIYTVFLVRILTEVWFTISPPIYQWEIFNEILIIKANTLVNIFIVENWSQIVHIEDHMMFYTSKLSKGPDTNTGQTHRLFKVSITLKRGPGGWSGKALGYGLDGPGSIPGVGGVEIFLHSFGSRLVLGSTQPPIKWVPGNFSGGKGGRA